MIASDLLNRCDEAVAAAERLLESATPRIREKLGDGGISSGALDREQRAAHALAWYATYVEALKQMSRSARALEGDGRLGEIERRLLQAAFGEYLAQLHGGIALSQSEIARPYDLGLRDEDIGAFWSGAVADLAREGTRPEIRAAIGDYLAAHAGAILFVVLTSCMPSVLTILMTLNA